MSFIPGEASSAIGNITTGTGSGIVSAVSFGVADLTSALVAGSNVTLTPTAAFGGKGLRIDTTPGISGVTSVNAGTGITITGTGANPIVNNAGVLSVSTTGSGSGITITGTAQNPQLANAGVLSVSTTGSASGITVSGTAQNPQIANAGVLGVNSQQGQVTLASSGATVTITTPTPGTINLEAAGGAGTLTGITAGTGISVTPTNPAQPTITNTGVTSLTAGNNMLVSAPSGAVTLAAKVARPMLFQLAGSPPVTNGPPSNFPIAFNNVGNFNLNTATTFGDLLAGTNDFFGVSTGTVIMDMSSFNLSMVTGQPGNLIVYVNKVGAPGAGLQVQVIYPSAPSPSISQSNMSLGHLIFNMADFRAAFGTGGANAFIYVAIYNQNTNTAYVSAGYPLSYIAWYWPDSIV